MPMVEGHQGIKSFLHPENQILLKEIVFRPKVVEIAQMQRPLRIY